MKPRTMRVHIGRLVVDAALGDRMPTDALASAVQAALTSFQPHGLAPRRPSNPQGGAATSLPGTIAAGIADRLGTMNIDASMHATMPGRMETAPTHRPIAEQADRPVGVFSVERRRKA
jgi:hypothetical protein